MKMKLLFLLMTVSLAAQNFEVGLNVSNQKYSGTSSHNIYPTPDISNSYDSNIVVAARLGYSLIDIGPALFQITAVYQPRVDTNSGSNSVYGPSKLGTEYLGLGGMFNFKSACAFGAGVDVRSEKSTYPRFSGDPTSNSYVRPWARLNVGYASPSPLIKPFAYFEVSAPLIQKDNSASLQFGIYAGIRF